MKVLFVIYPEIDSLLEKIDTFYQKLKQISMQLGGSSLFMHCSFDNLKNYTPIIETLIIIEARVI